MKQFAILILLIIFLTTAYGQKISKNKLDDISMAVKSGTYPNLEGLIIAKNGKTVYEKYYHGFRGCWGIMFGIKPVFAAT